MRFTATALTLVLFFGQFVNGQDNKENITIEVDKTKIKIPVPSGFVAAKSKLKSMATYMERNTPGNSLHELFADKDVTEESYRKNGLVRNLDVQTVKSLNNKMTQTTFDGVKGLLTRQFDQMMNDVLKKINKDDDTVETINKSQSGAFVDEDDSYAYLFFSSIKTEKGNVERASAAAICFIKGNMVMLNVHSNISSKKDVEWVKETSKKWLEATLKANGDE